MINITLFIFFRYGMLSPTKKQWKLYHRHQIEQKRQNVWSSVQFGHGSGRDEALQWMISQLFASSSTPHQSKNITLYPHYRRKEPITKTYCCSPYSNCNLTIFNSSLENVQFFSFLFTY